MAKQNETAVESAKENKPAIQKKSAIVDGVLTKVEELQSLGQLELPKDYSAPNALKAAYLVLIDQLDRNEKPVLESCTSASIANALLKMVVDGGNVMKGQGSFIPYGNKLTWQREYAGTLAIAKRDAGVKHVNAQVIYEKDVFEYAINEEGVAYLVKHETSLKNIDLNNIEGAYCIVTMEDGTKLLTVMNIEQIKKAWMQGAAKGNSPAHKNFPDQMCIKTVINRALKLHVRSSDDSHLYSDDSKDYASQRSNDEVKEHQATEEIEFEEVAEVAEVAEEQKTEEQSESAIKPSPDF